MRKPKQPKQIAVRRGPLYGVGATKTEAQANLDQQIDWVLTQPDPTIEFRFGHVIVAYATHFGDSGYVIVFPGDAAEHGKTKYSSTLGRDLTRDQTLQKARSHVAQIAWTLDVTDDAAFAAQAGVDEQHARELVNYFAWQRRYAAARAEGASDGDAHAIASGLGHLVKGVA